MKRPIIILILALLMAACSQDALVFQSDFGVKDGAVASMKGVAVEVSADLRIYDLTHEIPAFNIWEAALQLDQTAPYWPAGTVFVSVVDPGVGSDRKSVILKTKSGHYFVTPDNGTLTFVAEHLGIEAVREIDEAVNRRQDSEASYTFHGRDVYAFVGARLAAGVITYEEVGDLLPAQVNAIAYQKAAFSDAVLTGNIPILDIQFGNIWTNIDRSTFEQLRLSFGRVALVIIRHADETVLEMKIPYHKTFNKVTQGQPLIYLNSLGNVALALNQGDFAKEFQIESGAAWTIEIHK